MTHDLTNPLHRLGVMDGIRAIEGFATRFPEHRAAFDKSADIIAARLARP